MKFDLPDPLAPTSKLICFSGSRSMEAKLFQPCTEIKSSALFAIDAKRPDAVPVVLQVPCSRSTQGTEIEVVSLSIL